MATKRTTQTPKAKPTSPPAKVFGHRTYNFRDKDPIIDVLRTIIHDERLSHRDIAAAAGVAETTLFAWFYGLTRRPQFATVKAVCRACGYELEPTKLRGRLS